MDPTKLAGELVMRCFNLRTIAHIAHLKTKSYANHVALGELYDGIVPLTDSFAEAYQGTVGLIQTYTTSPAKTTEPVAAIGELTEWIALNRSDIAPGDMSHIQNLVDEIVALLSRTRYKLVNLK